MKTQRGFLFFARSEPGGSSRQMEIGARLNPTIDHEFNSMAARMKDAGRTVPQGVALDEGRRAARGQRKLLKLEYLGRSEAGFFHEIHDIIDDEPLSGPGGRGEREGERDGSAQLDAPGRDLESGELDPRPVARADEAERVRISFLDESAERAFDDPCGAGIGRIPSPEPRQQPCGMILGNVIKVVATDLRT